MAGQWSDCALRALRPSHCLYQLDPMLSRFRLPSTQCSRLSATITSQHSQRRQFSATASKSFEAAPPIDLEEAAPKGLIGYPTRLVPASPSYFTGTPKFIDDFLMIDKLQSRYGSLPKVSAEESPQLPWLAYRAYQGSLQEKVPPSKYERMVDVLKELSRIEQNLLPKEVEQVVSKFLRPGAVAKQPKPPPTLDESGRARAIGRRKTSHAAVWLVEGDGQVIVNGRSISSFFGRLHDRESALWALRSTGRMDKYNVFAKVGGGGVTGQAEAIELALARALLVHEPALEPVLSQAGVLKTDPRQVERKKPGHLKARKMPTWVKR